MEIISVCEGCGAQIYPYPNFTMFRCSCGYVNNIKASSPTILQEAERIVNGERSEQYGPPEDSFARIAEYWSVKLKQTISAVDVAEMMILFKIAREEASHKRDNWVDMAGYAEGGYRCAHQLDQKSPQ